MFALRVKRASGAIVVLPHRFATITEAKAHRLNGRGTILAVVYAANGETAQRLV